MPNTLLHLGAQGLLSKALFRGADVKWIYLGCVLPDIPWILNRIVQPMASKAVVYDLKLYVAVQSSLMFCLVAAAALACLARRSWFVFAILAFGSLMHLLLDACQTKWGNGVILFAPYSWDLVNFGLFWPESSVTFVLTGFGIVFFAYAWHRFPVEKSDLVVPRGRAAWLFAVTAVTYVMLPLWFLPASKAADVHFVDTLQTPSTRAGKQIALDRVAYIHRSGSDVIRSWTGEELHVVGVGHDQDGRVSIRGHFVDPRSIFVERVHVHYGKLRDYASYVGLALMVLAWGRGLRAGKPKAQ